jgi:hypothetical protein
LRLVLAVVHHRVTNVLNTRRRLQPAAGDGPLSWSALGSGRLLGRRLSSVPVAGGVEASPQTVPLSVPPGPILGAAGDCMPAAREHANSTFPWARINATRRRTPAAGRASGGACQCGGLSWGTFSESRFLLFQVSSSPPENPSFGDH